MARGLRRLYGTDGAAGRSRRVSTHFMTIILLLCRRLIAGQCGKDGVSNQWAVEIQSCDLKVT